MAKKSYFHWKKPREVEQWHKKVLKNAMKNSPRAARLSSMFWKILMFLLFAVWIAVVVLSKPKDRLFSYYVLVLTCLVEAMKKWIPTTYLIAPRGLRVEGGMSRNWYRWNDIEYYRLEMSFGAPNIGCILFKVKTRKGFDWPQFYFDTREIDGERLRGVLAQHLPDKEMKV